MSLISFIQMKYSNSSRGDMWITLEVIIFDKNFIITIESALKLTDSVKSEERINRSAHIVELIVGNSPVIRSLNVNNGTR